MVNSERYLKKSVFCNEWFNILHPGNRQMRADKLFKGIHWMAIVVVSLFVFYSGMNLLQAEEYEYEDGSTWDSQDEAGEIEEEKNQKKQKAKALKHYTQGKEYQLDQKYRDAIRQYQHALSLNSNLTKARRALAWAKRDLKRQKRSATSTKKNTLDALVQEAKDHYKRGRRFERENKPVEAASAYKDAIRLIPGYPEAKEALHRVQSQAQRSLAPLPYSATSSSKKAPQAHQPLDMTSRSGTLKNIKPRTPKESRLSSSTNKTKIVQSKVSSSYKVPVQRGQRSSESQQSIRGAIQNHYLQGCQVLDQGDYSTAIKEFELILEFEPEHREAQYKLNVAKKRQSSEVKTAKRKAELAQSKGDTMGALSALRDIVNIDPNNEEALEAWEKTKRENKGISAEIYRKGVRSYAKGDYHKALQAWELVLDINPKHKKARENITKVRQKMELVK
jgi:tetratricopeptide (TPR) repeat protein